MEPYVFIGIPALTIGRALVRSLEVCVLSFSFCVVVLIVCVCVCVVESRWHRVGRWCGGKQQKSTTKRARRPVLFAWRCCKSMLMFFCALFLSLCFVCLYVCHCLLLMCCCCLETIGICCTHCDWTSILWCAGLFALLLFAVFCCFCYCCHSFCWFINCVFSCCVLANQDNRQHLEVCFVICCFRL